MRNRYGKDVWHDCSQRVFNRAHRQAVRQARPVWGLVKTRVWLPIDDQIDMQIFDVIWRAINE